MRNTLKLLIRLCSVIIIVLTLGIFGCASIQHPTGGVRDSVAPKILNESPPNFTTNFKGDEIKILFDEYFRLSNEYKEISISPAMEKVPVFKPQKKTLSIKFLEKLQDSTTYTINFGKALADINEGNILKNYMYVLSTGDKIDSLSISGTVTDALTKKPVLDATVFLLPVSQDSLFGKRRASIFTTTDSSGNYSLKYLRSNTYNIYALKEQGGDRIYNSTNEQIAFYGPPIKLTENVTGMNLELFKEQPKTFRVDDRKIEKDGRITYIFNTNLEKPTLKILNPSQLDATKTVEFARTNDTAYVWTESMEFDSIVVSIQEGPESLDTVLIRRNKRDTYTKTLTIFDNTSNGRLRPGADLILTMSAPVKGIDGKKIVLLQDSLPVNGLRISRDSISDRILYLKYPWRDEKMYSLSIAENGLSGVYGGGNKDYNRQFSKDTEENYGKLVVPVTVPDTSKNYILQLVSEQEKILTNTPLRKNIILSFPTMSIGKYYIRVVYDENKNNKWDTGNVSDRKQPERIWNYPTEISLRANFDIEQPISIPPEL